MNPPARTPRHPHYLSGYPHEDIRYPARIESDIGIWISCMGASGIKPDIQMSLSGIRIVAIADIQMSLSGIRCDPVKSDIGMGLS